MACHSPRWLQVAGWSDIGKTRVLEALIPRILARGETVWVIKLSHHSLPDLGGDTGRLLGAGAAAAVLAGANGALWQGDLDIWGRLLTHAPCDWILVEGGRMRATPKVVLGQENWPDYCPPVLASVGLGPALAALHFQAHLPKDVGQVAAWLDIHRMGCSVPINQIGEGWCRDGGVG